MSLLPMDGSHQHAGPNQTLVLQGNSGADAHNQGAILCLEEMHEALTPLSDLHARLGRRFAFESRSGACLLLCEI